MIDLARLRLAICTDTYPPQVNGVARTLARLVEAVRQRGGKAQVFTVADPEAVEADDIVRFSSRPFWAYPQLQVAFPGARAMTSALRTFEPTVVHVATEFGIGLAGRAAARRMAVPLVTSYHTNFAAYAAHYQLGFLASPGWQYLRWFHNGAMRTFCPTEAIRSDLRQRGIRRSRVWSRGVDSDRFSPVHRSSELREKIGASDDSVVISYIGRLAPEKGIPMALEAMRLTALARPGRVRFLIGGDGPIEGALRERAPSEATFLGRLEGAALSAAFASSDLFVFPSTTDTFGNVMLEAMASGVPVVGADVPPTREVLGTDGWLIEPGNAPAMARQLIHLVDHPDELALMKRRARERAMQQSWDQIWDRLGSEYLALQARPAHPQSILHTLPST